MDSLPTDSPSTAMHAGSSWVADAERYDRWFESPWGAYAFSAERQAILDAAGNLSSKTVADIGCGTGRFTTDLQRDAGHVVGLDPDLSMLAVAARRTQAPLVVGDGHRLPFADHRFDLTVAITVCEFATDPATVVAELSRVTRPGGRVVVGALNRHSPWGVVNRHQFGPRAARRFAIAAWRPERNAAGLMPIASIAALITVVISVLIWPSTEVSVVGELARLPIVIGALGSVLAVVASGRSTPTRRGHPGARTS